MILTVVNEEDETDTIDIEIETSVIRDLVAGRNIETHEQLMEVLREYLLELLEQEGLFDNGQH
jgi:hypothetical protein